MTTQDRIDAAKVIQSTIALTIRSFYSSKIVRNKWLTSDNDTVTSHVFERPLPVRGNPAAMSFTQTVRTYHLQRTALQSGFIKKSSEQKFCKSVQAFIICAVNLWEKRFQSELARVSENHTLVKSFDEAKRSIPPTHIFVYLCLLPRRSLFGCKINQFKRVGDRKVINKKFDRCPEQILSFHKDIAWFCFPDDSNSGWVGEIRWHETPQCCTPIYAGGYYRLVAASATKPVRPELGTVITILPGGLRGLLYRLVWGLLRIKP